MACNLVPETPDLFPLPFSSFSRSLLRQSDYYTASLVYRVTELDLLFSSINMKEGSNHTKGRGRACDNCRLRKVRCDRASPCQQCTNVMLSCTYSATPRRMGSKGRTAPVLSALLLRNRSGPSAQTSLDGSDLHSTSGLASDSSFFPEYAFLPQMSKSSPECDSYSARHELSSPSSSGRISSAQLLAHVRLFMRHLFFIMPALDVDSALHDCTRPDDLPPRRYALLLALCATTRLQLKLDTNADMKHHDEVYLELECHEPALNGEFLVTEELVSRKQFDSSEEPDVDALLTAFFLFASYGNLNKQDQAWFYLSQSISILHALNFHC